MDGDFSKFAQRLKAARLKRGISQKHLAERVGIRSATLSAYENVEAEKRVTPSLENAVALARELEVSLDYLCGIDAAGIKKSATDEMREYLYTLTRTRELLPTSSTIYANTEGEDKWGGVTEWMSVNFQKGTAVHSFLKGWADVWKLYRDGALDEEIYAAVVGSLCDKYAALAVEEENAATKDLPF